MTDQSDVVIAFVAHPQADVSTDADQHAPSSPLTELNPFGLVRVAPLLPRVYFCRICVCERECDFTALLSVTFLPGVVSACMSKCECVTYVPFMFPGCRLPAHLLLCGSRTTFATVCVCSNPRPQLQLRHRPPPLAVWMRHPATWHLSNSPTVPLECSPDRDDLCAIAFKFEFELVCDLIVKQLRETKQTAKPQCQFPGQSWGQIRRSGLVCFYRVVARPCFHTLGNQRDTTNGDDSSKIQSHGFPCDFGCGE